MTWSVCAMGMPGPVRANLAGQFACAKERAEGSEAERVTIEAIEKAVNSQLDLIGRRGRRTAVRVISTGVLDPASAQEPEGSPQLSLIIECLPEFLAHGREEEWDES